MAYPAPKPMNLAVSMSPASPQAPVVPPTDPRMGKPTNGLAMAPQVAQMPVAAPQAHQAAPMRQAPTNAPAAPAAPAQAAFSTNGLAAMAPKPRQAPGPLRSLAQSFARGMAPEGYAQGQKGAQDERMAQLAEMQEKAKASLIWIQQTAQQPTPQARAAFTLQNAQAIAQATGQPVEKIMQSATDPNAFSDEAMQSQVAAFSGYAGIAPEKPEFQFINGGDGYVGVGNKADGTLKQLRGATPERKTAKDVNGYDRYIDTGELVFDGVEKNDPEMTPYQQESLAIQRARLKKGEGDNGPDFSSENQLRNQYLQQAKTFRDVRDGYTRVRAVGQAGTPAEQMSLIFGYMKLLDPASTVREGEYANAQNTTGIPGGIINAYNRAKEGKFLNETQVGEFLSQANAQYQAAEQNYAQLRGEYEGLAKRYGMDPQGMFPDYTIQPQANPGAAPAPQQAPRQPAPQGWGAPTPNGSGPMGFPAKQPQAQQAPSGPVRITSAAQRDALPPGTSYVAPDGSVRVKQ